MGVEIIMPDESEWIKLVQEQLRPVIDAMLSVADQVPVMLKEKAILDNEDVDGNQMNPKKPRPKRQPRNFPTVPLIQNDEPDLMSPTRWRNERTGDNEVTVTFTPPDHLKYLIEKAPDAGGRKWITQDAINPNAKAEIEAEMKRRAGGAM